MSSMSAGRVAQSKAEWIEITNNRRKPSIMRSSHRNTKQENLSCQCMICGEYLDRLTIAHCEKHGYKTKDEIVKAGYIRFIRY